MITFKQFMAEETRHEYFKRLTKTLNIKKLGSGMYATVFQHPVYHNVAVKYVNPRVDPMFMKYVRLCQKHQENRWIPKIVSIESVKIQDDWDVKTRGRDAKPNEPGVLIFFQKLRHAKKQEINSAFDEILNSLPDEIADNIFADNNERNFENMAIEEWRQISKYSSDPDTRALAKILMQVEACDIHNGNVMMRDEGGKTQLVFTDPVAS